ncbi:TPA: hypothetical protein ENX78_14365 [Candidatus Poribacteria bacterium]|nr:hypothetical protein [Candidatus Poribacteria bacterium]
MSYPNQEDYITFLMRLLDEFDLHNKTRKVGHPYVYENRSFICFFAVMTLKRCFAFKAMYRWLSIHSEESKKLGFPKIPTRATISRRYKALYNVIQQFVHFIADWASPLGEEFSTEIVYEDKSLFKARGPVWHKKDMQNKHIPEKLRNLDTDATWSKSAYHSWVFGYGLHITCTSSGFPIMLEVDTASVGEQDVMNRKEKDILSANIGYLIGDDGYTNFQRTKEYAREGLLLVTPALHANGKEGQAYHRFIEQPFIKALLQKRKTVIEPLFDLISGLLGTESNHKQLPLKGKLNVRSFLAFGVLLTQLALLMNNIYGLPFHNISHLLTVFL